MSTPINKSTYRQGQSGRTHRWPNRADYAQYFVDRGDIDAPEDFDTAHHLHAPTIINWLARGQTGCRFASHLSRTAQDSGWQAATFLAESVDGGDIGHLTDSVLSEFFDGAELVLLMFPTVNTVDQVVALLANIVEVDNWSIELIPDPSRSADLVGLRWLLPTGTHLAWVVGFAPIDQMPFTRRAPITTLAVRTSVMKQTPFSRTDDNLIPVHLADIAHHLTHDQHESLNRATIDARNDYLNGEHVDGARARVTFRLPRGALAAAGLTP